MATVDIERKVYSNQNQIMRTKWKAKKNEWARPDYEGSGLVPFTVGDWVVFYFSAGDAQITSVAFSSDLWNSGQKGIVYLLNHLPSTPDSIPSEAISSMSFDVSTGRYYSDEFSSLNVLTEAPHQLFIVFHKTEGLEDHITFSQAVISAEAEDIQPTVSLLAPDPSAIQDAGSEITLVWDISGIAGYDIADIELQYKAEQSDSWTDQSVNADAKSYTFQAEKFSTVANRIDWRVRAKTNYSEYSQYVQSSFPIIYYTPAITLIKPVDISILGDQTITFTWQIAQGSTYVSGTQMCYSEDSGETWTCVLDSSSSVTSKNISGTTISLGTVLWRVRARDAYGGWGDWAEASFTLSESIPTVSNLKPSGIYQDKAKPIALTWSATISYGEISGSELEYDLSDGQGWRSLGTVTGSGKSYTVPANTFTAIAYTDASHKTGGIRIRVRSKNRDNGYSSWTESSFATIDAIPTCTPKSPINGTSRDETGKITVLWRVGNSLGTTPKGGHAQYRVGSNGNWIDLFDEPYIEEWAGTDPTKQDYGYEADENTFPGAVIYWRVRAYNQDGVAGNWSSEAYFSTVDKPQVTTAISPINTVEDADKPILFTWSIYSQSGEASRGADLEYSLDGNSWIAFGHKGETGQQYSLETAESFDSAEGEVIAEPVSESTQTDVIVPEEWSIEDIENDPNKDYYTAPAGLIPPGVIFWHVRSYNRNLSPGEWSEAVSFVAKAAPVVQDLQVTAKPFATVIWQSNDQQNYEIFVDGESLGIFFGTERQYPLPDYLKDGVHTIGLRVLGSFDLWSRIAETQVTIENTPTSTLTLRAPTNIDTALEWTGGSGDFFVYRDGLMIAHTNAHNFTDRTALGEHDYQVIERLASGDYNASTVITRTPDVYCLHIAALSGGEWIPIPHRLKNESNPEYSESQEVVYNHLAGIYEPVASIGQYRDDSGKYSAVFLFNEQEEYKRFRALRGKPIILKTADGEVMIGILHAWERKHVLNHYRYAERREIYAAYSFTIQRIGWGDYIDVPN